MALLLGYASLGLVVSIVSTAPKVVRASRADLGVIKLTYGAGPSGVKGWTAEFNLDVDIEKAWAVLARCERLPEVLKGVSRCALVRREGGVKVHRMELTHPKGAYMKIRTEYDLAHFQTHWKMLEGSFQAAEGGVRLKPHPSRKGWTRVSYSYFLAISPLLPESFEVPRVRRMVRRMAREIQRFFSGQPARPPAPDRVDPGRR